MLEIGIHLTFCKMRLRFLVSTNYGESCKTMKSRFFAEKQKVNDAARSSLVYFW